MRRYAVDASVAVKWFVPESGYELAAPLLAAAQDGSLELIAPDLIVAEFGSALWRKAQAGEISEHDAILRLPGFLLTPISLIRSHDLAAAALETVLTAKTSFYDALYVSAARSADTQLVTADLELVKTLRRAKLGRFAITLSDLSL